MTIVTVVTIVTITTVMTIKIQLPKYRHNRHLRYNRHEVSKNIQTNRCTVTILNMTLDMALKPIYIFIHYQKTDMLIRRFEYDYGTDARIRGTR